MENDGIEVVSSEGGTGMPPAPSNPTPTEPQAPAPAAPETAPTAAPEGTLYELPDGRKVDGETLAREWKENFMPDYTHKSQELSKLKNNPAPSNITTNQPAANPYSDPDYVPQSYEEIIKAAEERALKTIEDRHAAEITRQAEVETMVSGQIAEIKKTDPTLDENALFVHANKYGFKDLPTAYKNMKDMAEVVKNTMQTTAKNIQKRSDPVSTTPGSTPTGTPLNPSHFANAIEYMRAVKGTQ